MNVCSTSQLRPVTLRPRGCMGTKKAFDSVPHPYHHFILKNFNTATEICMKDWLSDYSTFLDKPILPPPCFETYLPLQTHPQSCGLPLLPLWFSTLFLYSFHSLHLLNLTRILSRTETESYNNSFLPSILCIWNGLPANMKSTTSIRQFNCNQA